jgi:cytochrome c oxidase cbb3-type subunit III
MPAMNQDAPRADPIRAHQFDGIQEYDNQLPRWWVWLFALTVVVAPIYVGYFHAGQGRLGAAQLAEENRLALEERARNFVGLPPEDILRGFQSDPVRVANGHALFNNPPGACFTCHGNDLLGQVGPNLRDDRWKYGNTLTEIVATIRDGKPEKGMPPQAAFLTQNQMLDLALFIVSENKARKANGQGKQVEGETEAAIAY